MRMQKGLIVKMKKHVFAKGGIDIPMSKGDRELVWADCFNAKKLDTEFWNPLPHMGGSDIERKMDASTYEMRDGSIFLTSYKKTDGSGYVSPYFLMTTDRMEFKYGYFEITAKVPFYKGNSAAFWFCSNGRTKRGNLAEIDMVELLGSERNVVSNLHSWGKTHTSFDGKIKRDDRSHIFDSEPEKLREEYHTYFMDWTDKYIDFGVDGEVYCHADLTAEGKKNFRSEKVCMNTFHQPVHVILSEFLYTPGRKLGWGLDGTEAPFRYTLELKHVALYQKRGETMKIFNK